MPCCARWPASTWPRSSATARGSRPPPRRRALCAVVKADGYGHGARAGRARRAGRRRGVAGGRDRGRGRRAARRRGARGRCSCWARCRRRSSTSRCARAPTSSCWREAAARGDRAPRRGARACGPACTSSSTPAWAGSARATPTRPPAPRRPWPPRPALRLAGVFTHFATADEDDPAFLREQLARLHRAGRTSCARRTRTCSCTPPTPPPRSPSRAARLDMVRCGVGDLRARPVPGATRPRRAWSRRSSCAPTSPRSSRARRGRAPATAAASWPSATPGSARSRSATATATGAALTNNAEVRRRRAAACRWSARSRWTTSPSTSAREPRRWSPARRSTLIGDGLRAEELAAAAGHDQLRDHLRDLRAACRASTTGTGSRRERARSEVGARPRSRASARVARRRRGPRPPARPRHRRRRHRVEGDPRGAARRIAKAAGGAVVPALARVRRLARGRARATPGTSTCCRCATATCAADLAARDFTVNAMAEPLAGGEIVDPHGGARRPRGAAAADGLRRARCATTRCARCAPCASRSSSASRSSPPPARRGARARRRRSTRVVARARVRRAQARRRRPARARRPRADGARTGLLAAVLPELDGAARRRAERVPPRRRARPHARGARRRRRDGGRPGGRRASAASSRAPVAALLAEPLANELTRGTGAALRRAAARRRQAADPRRAPRRARDVRRPRQRGRRARPRRAAAPARLRAAARATSPRLTRHHLDLGFLVHERPLSRRDDLALPRAPPRRTRPT